MGPGAVGIKVKRSIASQLVELDLLNPEVMFRGTVGSSAECAKTGTNLAFE